MTKFFVNRGVVASGLAALVLSTALVAAPAIAQDRDITFAFGAPILTLDPGISAGSQAQTVRIQIMESLVQLNADTGAIEPLLAESWSVADDGVTWTFNLRPGVTFHDGSPLTAQDVKASFERLINPDSGLPRGNDLRVITEINAIDDLTVELVTSAPFGPMLQTLAQDSVSILSAESLAAEDANVAWNPIGTGPFRYDAHVAEQSVTLVRNDDYWGDLAEAETITFISVPEASTRLAMLETGEADIVVDVPGIEVPRLRDSDDIGLIEKPNTRLIHIGINMTKEPFDDVRVREALNLAVDREAIVAGVLGGLGIPANSVIAESVFGYAPQEGLDYDPDRARELLAEAGYPDGFSTTLWTPQGRYYMDREVTVAVQAMLLEIGISANVEIIDWSSYLTMLREPEGQNQSQLYTLGWETGTNDIQYILDTIFQAARVAPDGWNTMFYVNEELDALAREIAAEVDPEARAAKAAEAQAMIIADAPWVPLYGSVQAAGYRSDLSGIEYLPTDNYRLKNIVFE